MTNSETLLKKAYAASGMSFLGISFRKACETHLLRMCLDGWIRAQQKKGKPAPMQPALF